MTKYQMARRDFVAEDAHRCECENPDCTRTFRRTADNSTQKYATGECMNYANNKRAKARRAKRLKHGTVTEDGRLVVDVNALWRSKERERQEGK